MVFKGMKWLRAPSEGCPCARCRTAWSLSPHGCLREARLEAEHEAGLNAAEEEGGASCSVYACASAQFNYF